MTKLSPAPAPIVGFVSLGCPKNLVDSEVMMGLLDRAGARLTVRPEDAEILVVNTCSFIDTAKQESIDTILEMARHKTNGIAKKLIVAGCLVERYRDEIMKSIPEVDAVVGTGELESILEAAGIAQPSSPASPFNIIATTSADKRSGQESLAGTHKASVAHQVFRPEGDLREQQGRFSRDEWLGQTAQRRLLGLRMRHCGAGKRRRRRREKFSAHSLLSTWNRPLLDPAPDVARSLAQRGEPIKTLVHPSALTSGPCVLALDQARRHTMEFAHVSSSRRQCHTASQP